MCHDAAGNEKADSHRAARARQRYRQPAHRYRIFANRAASSGASVHHDDCRGCHHAAILRHRFVQRDPGADDGRLRRVVEVGHILAPGFFPPDPRRLEHRRILRQRGRLAHDAPDDMQQRHLFRCGLQALVERNDRHHLAHAVQPLFISQHMEALAHNGFVHDIVVVSTEYQIAYARTARFVAA